VGSLVSFARHGRVFVWLGGVLPAFRSTQANALLYWDAIQWARRLGADSVDLVGLPTAGIAHFKRQFGGVLTEYTVSRRESAVGRVLRAGRDRLSRSP
jgi:lipid II:glycine glycyltransferase (peptidoglycan interpeptide bridge formation enzyme)